MMLRKFGVSNTIALVVDGAVLAVLMMVGTYVGWTLVSRDWPVKVLRRELLDVVAAPFTDPFSYKTYFVRSAWCETKVNRWFVNSKGEVKAVDPLPYSMRTDGLFYQQESVTDVDIPWTLPSGPTEWCFRSQWKCNWTQNDLLPPGPILGPQECITFWVDNPLIPYEEFQREGTF